MRPEDLRVPHEAALCLSLSLSSDCPIASLPSPTLSLSRILLRWRFPRKPRLLLRASISLAS